VLLLLSRETANRKIWRDFDRTLTITATIETDPLPTLDREQDMNYVHSMFSMVRPVMIRSVFEEAVALASLSLFLATVAVWAQVLGVL